VIARYATRINGVTGYVLTKLDVLTGLDEIPICVAYDVDGVRHDELPMTQAEFARAVPIYESMPGWTQDISAARTLSDLPSQARDYITALEAMIKAPIAAVGVGPGREETIAVHDLLD
jgi:adenylosuccinate synthase